MSPAGGADLTRDHMTETLLELLRAEQPVESFMDLLAALPEDGRDDVRRAVDMALEVRSVLVERRRREAELAALYETAGDLSSLRDLEKVLRAIVRRARQLLATDAAYLTLMDDARGDTYMRVTDGIETEAFKNVRLEMGAGLGGLVAQTATPYATPDYASDHRFVHLIDDVVAGERIVAILGVPLRLGHRVIGVLFAANRRERPFAREEVDLLSSLAAHAAIAIENASLFQETQQALDDLRRANAIIQQHSEAIERAAEMHSRLTDLLLQGGGLADVAEAVSDVMGGALLVLDTTGRVTTAAGTPPDDSWARTCESGAIPADATALRQALSAAAAGGRTVRVESDTPAQQHCVAPVIAGAEHLGALVLACGGQFDEAHLRMLERAAVVTALVLLNQRSVVEAENRARGELLDDLLTAPDRDADGLRRRAALFGADLDRPHAVVVARVNGDRRTAVAAAAAYVRTHGGLSGEHLGQVVLLVPDAEAGAAADAVARRLRAATDANVTVGGAGPEAGPRPLATAFQDASRCLEVLLALGRQGQSASPHELGIYGLLFSQAGRDELDRFVHRTIGPVVEYDAARGTDLVRTLLTYFDCDGNVARTAAELFIHVNTLYQRLDRITRLLGDGWRHGDDSLQVHLAVKVRVISATA